VSVLRLLWAIAFGTGLATGLRLARRAARDGQRADPAWTSPPRPGAGTPAASQPAGNDDGATKTLDALLELEEDRERLIDTCIWTYENVERGAMHDRLRHQLKQVGIEIIEPADEPFDASLHEPLSWETPREEGLDGAVAQTLRAGVIDRGRVRRPAQVVVYASAGRAP
jgi:hypothetical protein